MPGYLLFSYKRHLYRSPISSTIDFPSVSHCLLHISLFTFTLPTLPRFLPQAQIDDQLIVRRSTPHPATSLPPFLSVLIFDVHHCYKRFPPSFESTSSFPPSRDSMPAHRNFSLFLFLSHCFALSFPPSSSLSLSTYVYLLHQAPLLSPPLISSRSLSIPDRYSFYLLVTFSSCFHVLHKLRSVTLPFPPVTFARF